MNKLITLEAFLAQFGPFLPVIGACAWDAYQACQMIPSTCPGVTVGALKHVYRDVEVEAVRRRFYAGVQSGHFQISEKEKQLPMLGKDHTLIRFNSTTSSHRRAKNKTKQSERIQAQRLFSADWLDGRPGDEKAFCITAATIIDRTMAEPPTLTIVLEHGEEILWRLPVLVKDDESGGAVFSMLAPRAPTSGPNITLLPGLDQENAEGG